MNVYLVAVDVLKLISTVESCEDKLFLFEQIINTPNPSKKDPPDRIPLDHIYTE